MWVQFAFQFHFILIFILYLLLYLALYFIIILFHFISCILFYSMFSMYFILLYDFILFHFMSSFCCLFNSIPFVHYIFVYLWVQFAFQSHFIHYFILSLYFILLCHLFHLILSFFLSFSVLLFWLFVFHCISVWLYSLQTLSQYKCKISIMLIKYIYIIETERKRCGANHREWESAIQICRNQCRPFWSGPAGGREKREKGEMGWCCERREKGSDFTQLFIEQESEGIRERTEVERKRWKERWEHEERRARKESVMF